MKFPSRYTLNLVRDNETKGQYVTATETRNQKVSFANIKYKDLEHFSWESKKRIALLEVAYFVNEEALKERMILLSDHWSILPS